MAIFKEDLLSVYGFDETYVGWGKEDSDLAVRMEILGFKIVSGRLAACVSHLFHGQQPRTALEANEAALTRIHKTFFLEAKKIVSEVNLL